MHILFVHQNFPAQFGHVAYWLAREHGCRCTFVTNRQVAAVEGMEVLHYVPRGGATQRTHYCTRTFENAIAHAHGVYEVCRANRQLKPDLIVGHSGFGSTLFLREVFDCPIINYFEYFYHAHGSDLDFRPEFPPRELDVLRSYARNAMLLLDLENCDAGYSPTNWQRSRFPARYQDKIEVIFDGVDTTLWRRYPSDERTIATAAVPAGALCWLPTSRAASSRCGALTSSCGWPSGFIRRCPTWSSRSSARTGWPMAAT